MNAKRYPSANVIVRSCMIAIAALMPIADTHADTVAVTKRSLAAEELMVRARKAAWSDKHPEAIRLYRKALAMAPDRRQEIVPALALQEYWAGHTHRALPLLREAVMLQPDNAELRYSLARCALQADLPLESAGHFRHARHLEPRNSAWLDDHATALHWSDLDDLAARLPATRPPQGILRRHEPQITTRLEQSHDSDDIDIRWLRVDAESPAGDAGRFRLQAGSGYLRQTLPTPNDITGSDAAPENPDIDLSSAAASFRWRSGEPGDDNGIWWSSVTAGERRADDWRLTQWALQTRWFPTDGVWLDAGAGNEAIDTPRAISNRIEVEVYSLSQTFRSGDLWLWGLGQTYLRFSDDNQRNRLTGWAERRLGQNSPVSAGVSALHFDDADPGGDNGYYSPERYDEARLYLDMAVPVGPTSGGLRIAGGRLRENPGAAQWLTAVDLRWEWTPGADHRLSARAGWSDSRAASTGAGDGYTREYVSVDWNWRP